MSAQRRRLPRDPLIDIVTNAEESSQTNPRSAIRNYYQKYVDSAAFRAGGLSMQERFLYEYLQACTRAALNTPNIARRYRRMAVDVAVRYIAWFGDVERRRLVSTIDGRVTKVIVDLGASRILAGERGQLLADYEAIPVEKAYYFTRGSLELWEDSLRAYPDFLEFHSDAFIKRQLRSDPAYVLHWNGYRAVLDHLAIRGPTQHYARVRIAHLNARLPRAAP